MKKLNYFLVGLAGLAMASCSQDEIVTPGMNGDGNVNLTVKLPAEMGTRATLSDGLTADVLRIAVYDADNSNAFVFETEASFGGLIQTTVSMNLPQNKTYNIAFFAVSEAADKTLYTFYPQGNEDATNPDAVYDSPFIYVNYEEYGSDPNLADAYDCFFQMENVAVGNSGINREVILNRPVAQINWGTSDLSQAVIDDAAYGESGKNLYSNLTVENAPYQFDLFNGVTSATKTVEITALASPASTTASAAWAFPVDPTTYKYIAMQYVLAPENQNIYNVSLDAYNAPNQQAASVVNEAIEVSNCPLQANYRTNIYGALLTNPTEFTVIKNQEWGGEYNMELNPAQPPFVVNEGDTPSVATGTFQVSTQGHLAWIAEIVNTVGTTDVIYTTASATRATETSNTVSINVRNASIQLENDLYMVGNWTPIGLNYATRWGGKFDGQNHTIYNLTVNTNNMTGFFGFMNGVVENLNFSNATITSNHYAGVVAGYSDNETGSMYIKNCKVDNSTVTLSCEYTGTKWDNGDKGGMILGYMVGKDNVIGCTVTNCVLQGYRDLGGIVGYPNGASILTDNKVDGLTINIDLTHNPENFTSVEQCNAGGIYGRKNASAAPNITGSTDQNVTINFGTVVVDDLEEAAAAAKAGQNVYLQNNVTGTATNGNGYGGYPGGLNVNGGIFDGNNFTLTVNNDLATSNWTSVIATSGGTIKNVTIKCGDSRIAKGILGWNMTKDLLIENVTIPADANMYYCINIDGANNHDVTINECNIYGYCSWGASVKTMTISDTYFGSGTYYGGSNIYDCMLKPYATTVFNNCKFDEWLYMDLSSFGANATLTFNNCTVNGVLLTKENHAELLKGCTRDNLSDWEDYDKAADRIFFN